MTTVDHAWMIKNTGGDPADDETAAALNGDSVRLAREIIDYDSEAPAADTLLAALGTGPPSLGSLIAIDWPASLAPTPASSVPDAPSLPAAEILMVTWTADEGHALSRVLTPGLDSHPPTASSPAAPAMKYWKPYTKNFAALSAHMSAGCPAREAGRLGTYWVGHIGSRQVTFFKSDSHFSQDGPRKLETTPNLAVWKQIIADVKPKWVITTGTAGGIGPTIEVGDVVVSRFVGFDASTHPKTDPNPTFEAFSCATDAPHLHFPQATQLMATNAQFLPHVAGQTARPRILSAAAQATGVLTTDGFCFDDSANTAHLQGHGGVCEMGDAVLADLCQQMGADAPNYVAIRNASDPQIDASDGTPAQQTARAAQIYKAYGKWSSVCSAIVSAAVAAAV